MHSSGSRQAVVRLALLLSISRSQGNLVKNLIYLGFKYTDIFIIFHAYFGRYLQRSPFGLRCPLICHFLPLVEILVTVMNTEFLSMMELQPATPFSNLRHALNLLLKEDMFCNAKK
jgi:hypothetical protein